MSAFAERLIAWQRGHGRHALPWQLSREPYRVWLSEIMLQQTQVDTVIPYYQRFLERFPTVQALAAAPQQEVLGLWSGLGYYARARNLHAAARQVVERWDGEFPRCAADIESLPGIGRSTAAAIAAFCFSERVAILDGNVKRVLCRAFGVDGHPGEAAVQKRLWALAESLLPARDVDVYIQAQMDLGATVCTRGRPACERCPLRQECVARREGRIADLPAPKPRKALPERSSRVLVLQWGDAVLLQRRPPAGLWGGLLVLPELEDEADDGALLARRFGCNGVLQALPGLVHAFTHFRLTLWPQHLCVDREPPLAQEDGTVWQALGALEEAPLPAPVRRILESLPRGG